MLTKFLILIFSFFFSCSAFVTLKVEDAYETPEDAYLPACYIIYSLRTSYKLKFIGFYTKRLE
jgi:hypothetical protein